MAPNNRNNRNKNFNNPSYFQKLSTSGFSVEQKTVDQIQRDTPKIFRDMAYRNVDYDRYVNDFLNANFLNVCIQSAYIKKSESELLVQSLSLLIYQGVYNAIVEKLYQKHSQRVVFYSLLQEGLMMFRMDGNVITLKNLGDKLFQLRYCLND